MDVDGPVASTSTATFTRPLRAEARYDPLESLSSGFVIEKGKAGSNAFKNQYASVYFSRLMALKPRVRSNAERIWKDIFARTPDVKNTKRVLDITQGSLCYVVGTIYMEMRLKPNILEELAREQYIQAPPPLPKFLSDDDEVMLEDESGRVRLVGKMIEERRLPLVTGVIAAVLGVETQSGDFEVVDICFAGMAQQTSPATSIDGSSDEQDTYVAIVSGLEMGINDAPADFRTGLLVEWLLGECGSEDDVGEARKVARVILAGNSMVQPPKSALPDISVSTDKKPRRTYGYDSSTYSAAPTAQLDNFLSDLLESVDVDLMCGEKDPCGYTLPQQALHPALLPKAGAHSNFTRTTNPCWFEVAGRSFLGSSGQTLDDIFKYLDSHDRISMASSSLEWSHIAPTAPDTLFCYPFYDRDPFILSQSPNVLFIGNQPEYQERLVVSDSDESISTRVILVPKFSETGQIVLVNCRTLTCKVVGFGELS